MQFMVYLYYYLCWKICIIIHNKKKENINNEKLKSIIHQKSAIIIEY